MFGIMRFVWNKNKNKLNQKKHRVFFEEAETCFYDDYSLYLPDPDHSQDEDRFIHIGMSKNYKIITISYVEEPDEVYRIISARPAHKDEIKDYERRKY